MSVVDNIRGSLLVGALGDSLGAPVEIFKLEKILERTGSEGVTQLLPYDPNDYLKWSPCRQTGIGVVTDDTCMLAATVAGLVVAYKEKIKSGEDSTAFFLHQAFLKWGQHQAGAEGNYKARLDPQIIWPVWFDTFCYCSGAGKNTMAALNSGKIGTIEDPILVPARVTGAPNITNEGCGGMMRVAPISWLSALGMVDDPYALGCKSAAITHGGAIAQTASGALALLIAKLTTGNGWAAASANMLGQLRADPRAKATYSLAESALNEDHRLDNNLDFSYIDRLPYKLGAITDDRHFNLFLAPAVLVQTLAIAKATQQWAASDTDKVRRALTLAVTQSGDSDSVGAIVGNILGAQYGVKAIPEDWKQQLQCLSAIESIASDLEGLTVEKCKQPKLSRYLRDAKL